MMPRILVIDNNVDSLFMLKSILQKTIPDCEVSTASFREQGIEKAKKELPDTILLDSNMMEKDSYEICRRLKNDAKMQNIPILLLSSNGDDIESYFRDSRIYVDAIIKKPWRDVELSAKINQLLRNEEGEDEMKNEKNVPATFKSYISSDISFVSSIKVTAKEFQKRTGVNCKARFNPKDIAVSKNLSNFLYEVVDEILSNVEKHANASNVKITVNSRNDKLVMKIADNGIGILEEKVNNPNSLGLKVIRERVQIFNGNVIVRGFVGKGTKIIVNILLNNKPE